MLTSTSATEVRRQHGFTLLEVLVVVTLLALLASLVIPMMGRDPQADNIGFQAAQLRDRLQQLSENSLFRGEVMALRLEPDGYTPMRYVAETQTLEPFDTDELLAPQTLPEDYLLEWELEKNDDPREQTLQDASQLLFAGKDEKVEKNLLPQLFFFPSGEATPVQLWLRNSATGEQRELQLDAIGRVHVDGEGEDVSS